jgi:hypothetical protein
MPGSASTVSATGPAESGQLDGCLGQRNGVGRRMRSPPGAALNCPRPDAQTCVQRSLWAVMGGEVNILAFAVMAVVREN